MSSEGAPRVDESGRFLLETSVLRTLCLTVNSEGSELKYRILDGLKEENFYFPVMRKIFSAVSELHGDGDQVVASSLQDLLNRRAVDVPDDFYLEDLFRGELPSMATLSGWMDRLLSGEKEEAPADSRAQRSPDSKAAGLHKTHPSLEPRSEVPASGAKAAAPAAAARRSSPAPAPTPEAAPAKTPPPSARLSPEPREAPVADEGPLAPESGQWLGFLAELTKKQGVHLKTGFSQLDAASGGLAPGLFLLAGEDREELADFLKQLVDQVAVASKGPCLYLSFERSKAALRLQTLSRLSGASIADIEKGRFAKESARWQEIVRTGEHAVEWLQRIYVVEIRPGLSVTRIRELRQSLLDSGAGAPRIIAVDNLEKLANESDLLHSVAELKELAEAFGVAVVGAATAMELVHQKSADMAAAFHWENGATVVKLTSTGSANPTLLRFEHRREIHRFEERPAAS